MALTNILAIDPGVTTGVASAKVNQSTIVIDYTQYRWSVRDLYEYLVQAYPDKIIIESFEYRPGHAKPNVVLYPVELIGVTELWGNIFEVPVVRQKASYGKGFWTDKKLKESGLYLEGLPHGRDACRHLLQDLSFGADSYLIRSKQLRLKE